MTESAPLQKGPPPILRINPSEIFFKQPLNRVMSESIKLINPSNELLAYKVKTTAPKRYCVRPNAGLIKPGEQIEIQVVLNLTKDPPKTLKQPDKFQIQSVAVNKEQANLDIKTLWANVPKDQIMKQKLKCHFSPPTKGDGIKTNDNSEDLFVTVKDTSSQSDTASKQNKTPDVSTLENHDEQRLSKEESRNQTPASSGDTSRKSSGLSISSENRNFGETNPQQPPTTAVTATPLSTHSTETTFQSRSSTSHSAIGNTSNNHHRLTSETEKRIEHNEQIKKEHQSDSEFVRRRKPITSIPTSTTSQINPIPFHENKHMVTSYFYWIFVVIVFLFGIWLGRRSKT